MGERVLGQSRQQPPHSGVLWTHGEGAQSECDEVLNELSCVSWISLFCFGVAAACPTQNTCECDRLRFVLSLNLIFPFFIFIFCLFFNFISILLNSGAAVGEEVQAIT